MIFDSHTHYNDARFEEDREEVLRALPGNGVGAAVNVGAGLASSLAGIRLAAEHERIWCAVGIHPDELPEAERLGEEETMGRLRTMAGENKVVAIGEIGLDYYGDYPDKLSPERQMPWFRRQLGLAKETDLPIIIHSRDAAADTLRILKEEGCGGLPLVVHCFSYSREIAGLCLDQGWYLGIGGVVTYKNGRKLKEVVQYMPENRILLETDCPYLAPVPFRGTRNWSGNLHEVVKTIGDLKQLSAEQVEQITWSNAGRFFRLDRELSHLETR